MIRSLGIFAVLSFGGSFGGRKPPMKKSKQESDSSIA